MALGIIMPSFQLVSLAACILAIMVLPFFRSLRIDWFSPWNMVCYAAIINIFLRSVYITFDIPNESTIQQVFLLGKTKEFLLWPMVVVLLGISCMTFGYLVRPGVSRKLSFRIFQSDCWSEHRFWFLTILLLLLSWIGFYLLITNTVGQLSIENLSAHRGIFSTELTEYRSYSYLRWMVNLSDMVYCLILAKMVSIRRIRFRELIVFLLSSGTSLSYYFFVQTRSGLALFFLTVIAIVYYMRGRKFPLFRAIVLAIAILFFLRFMTGLRPGSGFEPMDWTDFNLTRVFEPVVLNLNGIDVSKTAHIMEAIPTVLDYQYGKTLVTILFAWIPRELWPSKPIAPMDAIIAMTIFGAEFYGGGGMPPGLIAEMYLNFWFIGIIIGCFAVGYLLKIIHMQFKAYSCNRNIVLLYVTSFMPLGGAFMGSGFTSSLISFLTCFLPLYIVLNIITKRSISI